MIQFYPTLAQQKMLENQAKSEGQSQSEVLGAIVNNYYGLNSVSISALQADVFLELKKYASNPLNAGKEFDLGTASATYATISMVETGRKPATVRARIGREFAKRAGSGKFKNIRQVLRPDGTPKKSVRNRAAIYKII